MKSKWSARAASGSWNPVRLNRGLSFSMNYRVAMPERRKTVFMLHILSAKEGLVHSIAYWQRPYNSFSCLEILVAKEREKSCFSCGVLWVPNV